jgi:hypothetical protein
MDRTSDPGVDNADQSGGIRVGLQEAQRARPLIMQEIRQMLVKAVTAGEERERHRVAGLVRELPRSADHKLAPIFLEYGLGLRAQGLLVGDGLLVETGDVPRVKARGIEIGDLLLVVSLYGHGGEARHTALLLQARSSAGEYPPLPENDRCYRLYFKWPEFTYVKADPQLNGRRRRVEPPHLYNGAKYLFLRAADCPWPPFFCHDTAARVRWNLACGNPFQLFSYTAFPNSPHPTNCNCLVNELYDLLFGNGGRVFRFRPPEDTAGWDRVITDLMEATAALAAACPERVGRWGQGAGGGVTGKSPGCSAGLLDRVLDEAGVARTIQDQGCPAESRGVKKVDQTEYGGISMIEFVIEEFPEGRPNRS